MTDIKVGDEVRILKHRNRHDQFPEDGYTGTVTNVARKYATATYTRQRTAWPAGPVEDTIEFDMQTGKVRDEGRHYGIYIRTAEQYERDQRHSAAIAVLREAGFEVRLGHRPDGELIEKLAATVLEANEAGEDKEHG